MPALPVVTESAVTVLDHGDSLVFDGAYPFG